MADDQLRQLERLASQGDPQAQAKLLLVRMRLGQLSPARVALAAALGDVVARTALGPAAPREVDERVWIEGMRGEPLGDPSEAWTRPLLVRTGLAAARRTTSPPQDPPEPTTLHARLLRAAREGAAELVLEARDQDPNDFDRARYLQYEAEAEGRGSDNPYNAELELDLSDERIRVGLELDPIRVEERARRRNELLRLADDWVRCPCPLHRQRVAGAVEAVEQRCVQQGFHGPWWEEVLGAVRQRVDPPTLCAYVAAKTVCVEPRGIASRTWDVVREAGLWTGERATSAAIRAALVPWILGPGHVFRPGDPVALVPLKPNVLFALANAGITTLGDLTLRTPQELLKTRGIGPKTVEGIGEALGRLLARGEQVLGDAEVWGRNRAIAVAMQVPAPLLTVLEEAGYSPISSS